MSEHQNQEQKQSIQKPQQVPVVTGLPQQFVQAPFVPYRPAFVTQAPVLSSVQPVVQPVVSSVVQPVVQPVVQSTVQQVPTNLHQSYKGESQYEYVPFQREYQDFEQVTRTEYVPIQKVYTDYEAVQKVEQVPVTRSYTDYYTIEHQVEYVPQVSYTTVTEYVPQQKTYVEQVPVTRTYTEYVPETRYTTEYVPQQRQVENVEYVAVTKQVVHQPSGQVPQVVRSQLAQSYVAQPTVQTVQPVTVTSGQVQVVGQPLTQVPVQYVQQPLVSQLVSTVQPLRSTLSTGQVQQQN